LARDQLDAQRSEADARKESDVDDQVYDGLLDDHDRNLLRAVRAAEPGELADFTGGFHDSRMGQLLPRYKARNYPETLTDEERATWEAFRSRKLMDGGLLKRYFDQLAECAGNPVYADKQFLLEELQLYGQGLMPADLGE
ncbi:MAG TPA: hypothetical protein VF261_02890, partial [Candidatus Saccharimonadales bacterium]